jgi:hypothetical protein
MSLNLFFNMLSALLGGVSVYLVSHSHIGALTGLICAFGSGVIVGLSGRFAVTAEAPQQEDN